MRRFLLPITLPALAALAAAMPAAAKGPSPVATLTGPGLGHAVLVKGDGEGGPGTPLGSLVQFGGYFAQVFTQVPDPTTSTRPAGDLGPRYQVVYRVPGPSGSSTVVQDVYPYAKPQPVTYMRADQTFWGYNHTHGGWFVATPEVKAALVEAGLPATPAPPGSSFPWTWTAVGVAFALSLLVAGGLRRRAVPRLGAARTTG